ncbi:hypothetical protein [Aminobacter phage Erebus]|nr:hypothetical protein [Aminobacter phage Erebus]
MQEIIISNDADQQFGLILNNRRVTMRVRYNVTTDRWAFDLSVDDQPVLYGRRIVTGVDLLAPFALNIGAIFAVSTAAGDVATRDALPAGLVRLYHVSDEELDQYVASISA